MGLNNSGIDLSLVYISMLASIILITHFQLWCLD